MYCDFICSKNGEWVRHILTRKHKNATNATENQQKSAPEDKNLYKCLCGKKYNNRTGLWRHKKKCGQINKTFDYENSEDSLFAMDDNKDLVMHLLNQNKQLQDQIIEICKDKSITNNNTNNNIIEN